MVGITSYGGYIPRLRLSRESVAKANAWVDPGLMGNSRGVRAVRDVDEDTVTMAVEAARDCLNGVDRTGIDSLFFASTTAPFAVRQNATIIGEALNLRPEIATLDVGNSMRAGTSGLVAALRAAGNGGGKTLYVASDSRDAKAASVQELLYGDGAAALTLGTENVVARFLGSHSISQDFTDHFRFSGAKFDYYFEERWIRDEGIQKMVPQTVQGLAAKLGVKGADVSHFIMPCIIKRIRETLAKGLGIRPEAIRDDLSANCGDTGTAHALLMLAHTLEEAKPGDKILIVTFGQGVDSLLFEVTDKLAGVKPRHGIKAQLADSIVESNYLKYLSFKEMVEVGWGMRAESQARIRPSAAWRDHRSLNGLLGGRCKQCDTIQIPRAHICVNPECRARDSQVEYSLADSKAKVASFTVDRLAYSPHPPLLFGMIAFEEGAKMVMQFTGCDPEQVEVGMPMEMVFRIKMSERERKLRSYFWKAAPRTK